MIEEMLFSRPTEDRGSGKGSQSLTAKMKVTERDGAVREKRHSPFKNVK
jgi:hypothetical protein